MDFWDEIRISGFSKKHEFLNAIYREVKEKNHGRPVYKQVNPPSGPQFVYYWDQRDGLENQGWWLAPEIGGDTVWALARSHGESPPVNGWRWPPEGDPSPDIKCTAVFRLDLPKFSTDLEAVEKSLKLADKLLDDAKDASSFKGKRQLTPRDIKSKIDGIRSQINEVDEPLQKARKLQHDRQSDLDKLLAEQRKDLKALAEQKKGGSSLTEDKKALETLKKRNEETSRFQSRLGETQRKIKGIQIAKDALKTQVELRLSEVWKTAWAEFASKTDSFTKEYERWAEEFREWRAAPGFMDNHRRGFEAIQKRIENSTGASLRRAVNDIPYATTIKQLEKDERLFTVGKK
eukprot:GEMP01034885.1.p1 GENE.GEMP01034885.1~~GEMP01034885.1.p1  ORF type:complete len:347 (+),score=74.59 GEMP01034885.1:14-1054(+)